MSSCTTYIVRREKTEEEALEKNPFGQDSRLSNRYLSEQVFVPFPPGLRRLCLFSNGFLGQRIRGCGGACDSDILS